ncbi:MAG: hypothetical protein Aurels2KO_04260 [Aureliella sp.]
MVKRAVRTLDSLCYVILFAMLQPVGAAPLVHGQELMAEEQEVLLAPASLQLASNEALIDEALVLEGPSAEEPLSDVIIVEEMVEPLRVDEADGGDSAMTDDEKILFGDWVGYNASSGDTTWIPGSGDDFGMFSMESYPTLSLKNKSELVTGMGFHFLTGPVTTDMPARLYDFQLAFQSRATRSENFVLDYKIGIGAFSDFEGSARKGIRFPGHAVGYYQWQPWFLSVLGVEFLDRDDLSVLPVAGFIWRPRNNVVAQFVFPKPQLQVKITETKFLYLAGELGGDTWAIERLGGINDVVTYSDLRLLYGIADLDDDSASSIEFGWAFARSLNYRSGNGNLELDDAFIFRLHSLY